MRKQHTQTRSAWSTTNPQRRQPSKRGSARGSQQQSHQRRPRKSEGETACFCYGRPNHWTNKCWHKNKTCEASGQQGHLEQVCKKKGEKKQNTSVGKLQQDSDGSSSDDEEDSEWYRDLFTMSVDNYDCNFIKIKPQYLPIQIKGQVIRMEIDGEAGISLTSKKDYKRYLKNHKLSRSDINIRFYDGSEKRPIGVIKNIELKYDKITAKGDLYVMGETGGPLVGRDWLGKLGIWPLEIVQSRSKILQFIKKHANLFSPGLGTFTKGTFELKLKEGAKPKYCKPRTVPYASKDKIEKELDRLVAAGVLTPVGNSEWRTPVVPVTKPDGRLRLCADYKVTVNPQIISNGHPIPNRDHLINNLQRGKFFTEVDLREAYTQIPLEENSRKILTLSTHRGLFQPTKLPFGVASAPGYFQQNMEQILGKVPNVNIFFDNIVIKGKTIRENIRTTEKVFKISQDCGLKIKEEKFVFLEKKIRFLGFEIDEHGLYTMKDRVTTIKKIPEPTTIKELRAFLGTLNHNEKFIKDRATKLNPLYQCLQKDSFKWSKKCKQAFETAKNALLSANVLVNYDPHKPLIFTCDASDCGMSAILSHRTPEGDKPIAYASKTLSKSERNYAIIDKKARAIIFGVTKFYDYIYGTTFTLRTDHQPLVRIFGPGKGIPIMAARRLQRYATFLSAFQYNIEYGRSSDNVADGLSCLPLPKDQVLSQVVRYVREGWSTEAKTEKLKAFEARKDELTMEQDCSMWGYRVVIPKKYQKFILKEMHLTHMGIVKMKSIARSFFWWSGIDEDIEKEVRACHECVQERDSPPAITLNPWTWPTRPWQRIHTDLIGPLDGRNFLLIIDAMSKWPEIFEIKSISSESLIKHFKQVFSRFGIPNQIISDNGRQYTSEEFASFVKRLAIKHIFSPVKHPATNGAAENLVKTFKKKFKILSREGFAPQKAINMFLFDYRSIKHSTTGETPAKLMLGRELRTRFEILRPATEEKVDIEVDRQVRNKRGKRVVEFKIGEKVWARKFERNDFRWCKGIVKDRRGPATYEVKWESGGIDKRHEDQIIRRDEKINEESTSKNEQPAGPRRSSRLANKLETTSHPASISSEPSGKPSVRLINIVSVPIV
ncbi:uncharacterized protein K02A2.6-like [Diprion similis]|uniref:uncharacterized protein K02A2.6-like n=1 Tax=Diprion similis TaxID=362088 RepID=UPI001EF8E887|nr:uncharacterized protein K02A2.6-like [Diprion similis]